MSEKTNIAWCDSTGNPWIGCTKVSPGCKNCYAATMDEQRFSKTMGGGTKEKPISHWGKGAPRVRTKAFWTDAVKWNRDARHHFALKCQNCKGYFNAGVSNCQHPDICPTCGGQGFIERPRIFPSLCDWLDEEVPIEWLADFLKLIHDTPNLDWLLLTKRPENFTGRLSEVYETEFENDKESDFCVWVDEWVNWKRPPENVWIGVSVEDQKRADERIPLLLQIPAKVRFLSVEPLLSPVNLLQAVNGYDKDGYRKAFTKPLGIDWVIVGGESGKDRRDCGVEAICDVARQCQAAGVRVFVKQDCAFKSGQQGRIPESIWAAKQFPHA